MNQAIVIGSSGQVARALVKELNARKIPTLSTSSSGRSEYNLDLSSEDSIHRFFSQIEKVIPQAVVFLAGALTHVDRCETERDLCEKINAIGPKIIAQECIRLGYSLVYFSTEYVFGNDEYEGGKVGPFSEKDEPAPTSWYGECKLKAEKYINEITHGKALVLRTTMVFSWDEKGMNFFMQLYRHLKKLSEGQPSNTFRIPTDQISTPTYAPSLANAAIELVEKNIGGVVNIVGRDLLSRKEFVLKVIEAFSFSKDICLKGFIFLTTKELNQVAKRPLTAGLKTDLAISYGIEILPLDEAIARIKKLMNHS